MKLRKFELKTGESYTYKNLLDSVMSGSSTSDDIIRSVTIGAKVEDNGSEIWLSQEEHDWLLGRVNKTEWNALPANRKIIAEFVTYLRGLKEESVEVKGKK
jgi:hypothetical protein